MEGLFKEQGGVSQSEKPINKFDRKSDYFLTLKLL